AHGRYRRRPAASYSTRSWCPSRSSAAACAGATGCRSGRRIRDGARRHERARRFDTQRQIAPRLAAIAGRGAIRGERRGREPRAGEIGELGRGDQIEQPALSLGPDVVHAAARADRAVAQVADADVERDRTLDRLDDVLERDRCRIARERVAAVRPAAGYHQAGMDELLDDLLEELPRHALER